VSALDEAREAVLRQRAVHEQQAREEAELGDGKVRVVHSLAALLAGNADANVSRLQHGHVIGAVANGQRAPRRTVVDAPQRRRPA
jgi:hypothetical protein